MATIQELARQMVEAFELRHRDNGESFWVLKDGRPQWMQDAAHAAHGDMFPDDWRYEFIRHAAGIIADSDGGDEGLDEAVYEIEADVYNHDLLTWLASDPSRIAYVDEAMEEYGRLPNKPSIMGLIGLGQVAEKVETFHLLVWFLREKVERDDERCPACCVLEHDVCSLTAGCPCCNQTIAQRDES